VLDAPKSGCLNIHASLLPRWRGAAPIHRAIMAGDRETGVCIMQMEAGLDTGPVLLCEVTRITEEDTTGDLHDRLSRIGAALILAALDRLADLPPQPQALDGVTYAQKIDKAEARIDWSRPAKEVDRQIRGLSPTPGAWTEINGERVKFLRSRLVAGQGEPGQVLGGLSIACGTGAIDVTQVQREGRRAVKAAEFLNGMTLPTRIG
jgi:methionyl-tRNA formyltransferase